MNMQQMMIQAQKVQRELRKAHEELKTKEFTVSKGGLVTVVMLGSKQIKSIDIDKDALDLDNKEMIEESLKSAINEAIEQIDLADAQINESITGSKNGIGF